ncbi:MULTISPECIES: cupin domain-containing protein [Legionella]|uniref:Cupin domain-containing protein n=1 Tax=Legionella septentrionalis TaxID=2498109 RepID=A0A3S1CKT9_9GAMM|nr:MULTISPECIES: hypothetical protein [Legionella]MCP0913688.1 hypothetical protein [Legionella sp. 27cVA30]RUQ84467.1 hypothetical protein EKM59_08825 [Legionella septentrionalis]RUQ93690.1 hypothetical protein ELY11_11400 [Legionella septentrionalis]
MNKFVTLFSGPDNKSYFKDEDPGIGSEEPLGSYSKKFPAAGMKFRIFKAGNRFDWHNAPQPQFIIYLEGEVEVEASGGEKRVFRPGDVLFANDLKGAGHITTTLTDGRSIIVMTQDEEKDETWKQPLSFNLNGTTI